MGAAAPARGPASDAIAVRRLSRVSVGCAVGVIAVGVAVLIGWIADVPALKSVLPGLATMKANTALSFAGLGVALLARHREAAVARRIPAIAGTAVAALAVVTLLQYATGLHFGIDQLLFADRASSTWPGRMSGATAVSFALLAAAAAVLPGRPSLGQALAVAGTLPPFVALLGYVYGVPSLYAVTAFSTMALHTAATFVVAGVGLLLACPDRGFVRIAAAIGPGGTLARRLLPAAVLAPMAFGIVQETGAAFGWFDVHFGSAVSTAANVLCLTALLTWTAHGLQRVYRARIAMQEELREREQDLVTTLRCIGDGVIATDARGRVVRMNVVAEHLTGWSQAEAAGKPLDEVFRIVNEDTRAVVASPVDTVLRLGIVVGLANHTVLIARDGSERAIADSGAPIRGGDGVVRGVVLVFRDQTEDRRAERALVDGQARLRAMLEAALDGIVTVDDAGTIVDFNGAAERIFGHTRQRAIGSPLVELLIPTGLRARHAHGWQRYLSTGQHTILGRRVEVEGLHAAGHTVPIELAVVATSLQGRQLFTAYVRDLTERDLARTRVQASEAAVAREAKGREAAERSLQRAEEHLRQVQKMEAIGRLAGGIAHDFNNLLSVILGNGELMRETLAAGAPQRADLDEVLAAGRRAASLTRQLLAFSRQQTLMPVVLDLGEVCTSMQGMLHRLIGEDVTMHVVVPKDLGRVRLDRSQIEQVILNLAVNARDAMPSGGVLDISLANVDFDASQAGEPGAAGAAGTRPHVLLAITDTGVGIEPAALPHVFEPFFTTKKHGAGTGLGLAMVHGIVAQSGGHIAVDSQPGKGTTFLLWFPRTADVAATPAPVRPVRTDGTETILLVEDEAAVRHVVAAVLRRHGYTVIAVEDGAAALAFLGDPASTLHLLLTDVVMPGLSGPEVARRARLLRPGLKVLCMSGYTDDAVLRHGGLADFAFLPKPITPDELLQHVRSVLDSR